MLTLTTPFPSNAKNGDYRRLQVSRKEVVWNGEAQIQAIYKDVTEQERAEQALRESETKYRGLVNNVQLGIFRTDPRGEGKFLEVNLAMQEITGYIREELLNIPVIALYVDPLERAKFLTQINLSNGRVSREVQFARKDHTRICVAITDNPIRDESNRILFIDGILEDITERKKEQARLLEVETLKQANKAKSELLANVSHELRTPLASIKGFIESLTETDVMWSEAQKLDFLQSADREVDRLTFLIRDLLDMSRIDSGKMVLDKKIISIQDILDSAAPVLGIVAKKHNLKIQVAPGLPALEADKLRIAQVITNLVENATKFSLQGSLIMVEAQAAKGELILSVSDQGEGMTKSIMDNLFNRFYQAERVVSGKTRGTGLGLAICKGIVEAHGGSVRVESQYGRGSKFSISLPTIIE